MRWALALLLIASLAGCADATAPETEDEVLLDEELQATETTGVIRGVVVDATIAPIPGVTVVIGSQEMQATTNENGAFGFQGLEPGFYVLEASKPGHVPVTTQAEVLAGVDTPPAIRILMEADAASVPRADLYKFDGMVKCGLSYIAACGAFAIVGIDVGDSFMATFELPSPPQHITMEALWKGTQPTGDEFQLRLGHTPAGPDTVDDTATGPSPQQAQINATVVAAAGIGAGNDLVGRMFVWDMEGTGIEENTGQCVPVPTITQWCQGPGAAIDQKFELFTHAFYNFSPDEGWQFSYDGEPVPPS